MYVSHFFFFFISFFLAATIKMLGPPPSLLFPPFLSFLLSLSLTLTSFGRSRFSSAQLAVRIPPPALGNVCNVRACSPHCPPHSPNPSPSLHNPSPVGPLSRCSVHKWIHHPCVSCGTFLNRTHSDPL